MINIDSRLLDEVDADELYLLSRLANRVNKEGVCWPGNALLMKECKWSRSKLIRVKNGLYEKKILTSTTRRKENSVELMSNLYKIDTTLISNYTPSVKNDTTPVQNGHHLSSTGDTTPVQNGHHLVSESSREVLTNEVLSNEELTNEELNRENRRHSLISNIFEDLIRTFWKDFESHKHFYLYKFVIPEESYPEQLDVTTETFLLKIAGAAGKIYDFLNNLQRPRLEVTEKEVKREGKPHNIPKESNLQVNAYFDYCRLSKTYMLSDPDKLPDKIAQGDWCMKLYDFLKDKIEREEYDPAIDSELLLSEWLIHKYYWEPQFVYECKRYNNRIVYEGEEYLKVKK